MKTVKPHRHLIILLVLISAPIQHSLAKDTQPEVTVVALADPTEGLPHAFDAGWHGQKTCTLLYETASVRVGQCSFPPGVGHEKHYHKPHFGYVLEGSTMLIRSANGESESSTAAGETWSTDRLTIHEAVNIGDTTARYLIVEPKPAAN